jgi:hypothetical protein
VPSSHIRQENGFDWSRKEENGFAWSPKVLCRVLVDPLFAREQNIFELRDAMDDAVFELLYSTKFRKKKSLIISY